jgi:hypothetical protein
LNVQIVGDRRLRAICCRFGGIGEKRSMTVANESTIAEVTMPTDAPTAEWEAPTLTKLSVAAAESGALSTFDGVSYS